MRVSGAFRTLFVLIAIVFGSMPAAAQSGDPNRNYDFRAPMHTIVDVASKKVFSGWSGDCNSGRAPIAITLWRIDPVTKAVDAVPATVTYGARPYAAAWLTVVCGRPFDVNVGWSVVPNAPEPPGVFTYAVLVTDVPTSWTCGVYPTGYPNAGQPWCGYVSNTVYRSVE